MDDFFSVEPSETIKNFTGSTMEDCSSWNYTPLTTPKNSSCNMTSSYSPKLRMIQNEKIPERPCFILGAEVATKREAPPLMMFGKKPKQPEDDGEGEEEEEQERKKRVHRFLEEWPSSNNTSSVSTSLFI